MKSNNPKKKLKKNKEIIFIILAFSITLIILTILLFIGKDDKTIEEPKGFGDEANSDQIASYPTIPDETESPSYKSESPSGKLAFTVQYGSKASENVLKLNNGTEIKGVAIAKWNGEKDEILFNKAENSSDDPTQLNTSNLWIMSSDGTNQTQLFNLEADTPINFVSNGDVVGFVTKTKVGKFDLTNKSMQYLYEFEALDFPSDQVYIPGIAKITSSDSFQVEIRDKDYVNNKKTSKLNFEF